ncbi:hypothetical protein GQ55_4G003500 [Panicum hallii var. hallii]|uniref:Uncharacterized protein n=2 Tax=Panicum hallii TaxID=206008 RepID=A0A2T7DTQ3_9POAL|nr:hypothetical protein PAHAL_4G003100 [Panicum hallii]PUZ58952.1 hypothetical protein GQ55_4G003500 [Panicum hallii var. hallii]
MRSRPQPRGRWPSLRVAASTAAAHGLLGAAAPAPPAGRHRPTCVPREQRGQRRRWWKGDSTSAFHPREQRCAAESWLNASRTGHSRARNFGECSSTYP